MNNNNINKLGINTNYFLGNSALEFLNYKYNGIENILRNFDVAYENSKNNWILNTIPDIYTIILSSLLFKYNYIGTCDVEFAFRDPIIYLDKIFLETWAYPFNAMILNYYILDMTEANRHTQLKYVMKYTKDEALNKQLFIDDYIKIV